MKERRVGLSAVIGVLCISISSLGGAETVVRPVTPNASPEAVELLSFFYRISGKHTLTGQHNFPADKDKHTLAAAKAWGKMPAVFGKDWRPMHEMNGTWFWWGGHRGEYGTAAICKMMFDRLVNHHKIKNLIWVWSVDRPEGTSLKFEECWPGSEYVDILSLDCYREFKQSYYDELLKLAAGKPIALAEAGAPPSLEVLTQQPKWTWWMTWAGMGGARGPGGAEAMRNLVNDPRSWSLSDVEYRKAVAPIRLASGLAAEPPAPPAP